MSDHGFDGDRSADLSAMEQALETVAEVARKVQLPGFETLSVKPHNPKARSIWLAYMGDEIILEAGEHGGRFELERTADDVAFLIDVVQSIVAGRVREMLGWRRSVVEVTLSDGRTTRETGYSSLMPTPGWRRIGKWIQYEPYAT